MSELTHIFLCAVLKSLEIALQAHFSIKDSLTISECRNVNNNFLLSAKMTYRLSWKIIESKIAEPEKMIAKYFVYYQLLSFLICNFLVFLSDK